MSEFNIRDVITLTIAGLFILASALVAGLTLSTMLPIYVAGAVSIALFIAIPDE